MRYSFESTIPEEQNNEKYLKDVERHEKDVAKLPETKKNEKYNVKGIKGMSVLSKLPDFDCVWGFPFDYMHTILLGVARQLWNELSSKFLTVAEKKEINKRLLDIHPPNEIHRVPRVLTKKQAWKATEWRSWLLFYSVPILTDILKQELLNSYKLLVRSVQKLLSSDISKDDLLTCEVDLVQFIYDCQKFYGNSFMTYNLHCVRHMVQSVRENGPLSCTSAYAFENNIYNLKKKVTSPKGVLNQMTYRSLRNNIFRAELSVAQDDTVSTVFSKTILNKRKEVTTRFLKTNDGAVIMKDHKEEHANVQEENYNRCVHNGIMYHSVLYTKAKKTNNTIVRHSDGRIAQIYRCYVQNN